MHCSRIDGVAATNNIASSLRQKSKELSSLVLSLATLDPLLQQVLVVAVGPGAQGVDPLVGELATVGVYEHGHQAVLFARQVVDLLRHFIHGFLEERWRVFQTEIKSSQRLLKVDPRRSLGFLKAC